MQAWLTGLNDLTLGFREWLQRPVSRWVHVSLLLLALALPAWLVSDVLGLAWLEPPRLFLFGDDFAYFGASRTWERTLDQLWQPHNSHLVPVFRLWTWLVFACANRWEHLPIAAAIFTYALFVLVLLTVWHFVRQETESPALALGAILTLGISIVTQPAITWYSASQTLGAGLGVVLALLTLRLWRQRGGLLRLLLAGVAAWLAAGSWSGGFIVGPAAILYLWTIHDARCRKAALGVGIITLAAVMAAVLFRGSFLLESHNLGGRAASDAIRPHVGIAHTLQAIPEFLVLRNLGIETPLTASQSIVFLLVLLLAWAKTRGGRGWITPLESAGAILIVGGLLLPYTVRGYLPFDSLRELRWYCIIPQIGAVLFVTGWCASVLGGRLVGPLTRKGFVGLLLFGTAMTAIHKPASQSMFLNSMSPLTSSEKTLFPIRSLRLARAHYIADERKKSQRRFFARLDRIETHGRQFDIDGASMTRLFGPLRGPGAFETTNIFDLLDLPNKGSQEDAVFIRQVLDAYVSSEPDPRPPWLTPDEPWPRP